MPSVVHKVIKKTMRSRSKSCESNTKRKPAKVASEASKLEGVKSGKKKPPTQRKRGSQSKSQRKHVARSASKEKMEPKSQMSRMDPPTRSIDLASHEDANQALTPTTPQSADATLTPRAVTPGDSRKDDVKDTTLRVDVKEELLAKDQKPSKPKSKPWLGMEAAERFFNNHHDIAKLRAEYVFLDSLTQNKTTVAFEANTERNRKTAPKIYDENRIVLNRPGHEDVNYINASLIQIKDFAHKLIVAQLPKMENESFVEDFWYMIYQEQISLVYLLVPDESLQKAPTQLFKEGNGEYQYVGKMFINNRKTDVSSDPKQYTIEVLPEGNSDSVMCQVHHHPWWPFMQQPPKTRPIIKMIHQFLTEKEIQTAGVCVVSVFGSGRACSFIGALIAISQLNKGIEPNICEIMTNIKQQRPGATESFAQYAGIYAIVLDYISRKRGSKTDAMNKELNRFIEELTEISPTPSPKH